MRTAGKHEVPKRIERLLREYAAKAHEVELRRALEPLASAFQRWSSGGLSSGELSELIHDFHQGPARELFVRYNQPHHGPDVAHAVATGILDKERLPPELLDHLRDTIRMFEHDLPKTRK